MKRLIIILCLLISMHGFSQTEISKELFPTLAGLQRTACSEYTDCEENVTYLMQFDEIKEINGKQYLKSGGVFLREEDNKVLIYSFPYEKDLVLYDWTLEIGDTLQNLGIDPYSFPELEYAAIVDYIAYEDYDEEIGDFIIKKEPLGNKRVKDISTIRLLDGNEYKAWLFGYDWERGDYYIEGIGNANKYGGDYIDLAHPFAVPTCYYGERLVCVSRDGVLLYQIDDAEMERLGAECLCEYNAEQKPEDLFPTLWGLQRTGCTKTIGENENGIVWGSRSYLMQEIETATIDGKQYLLFGINDIYSYDEYCSLWLREENNKILLYSTAQKKDLVLYDFTLNVGDSLPRLYVDYDLSSVVDYDNDEWGLAPLVVTEVSRITLLDGKEYKKWTFDNGIEYVEGIGSFGSNYGHNDFYQLIVNAPRLSDVYSQHLVCASKNGQLLYQMDEAEMERLNTECLCDGYQSSYKDQWCDQWNILSHGQESDPDEPFPHARTNIYWLSENTINRNGYEYIPLMCSSSKQDVQSTHLVGELRFTEDKQVYFYYDNTEYLLYDFGAQVGDQLQIFSGINNYNYYDYYETYTHVVTRREYLDDGRIKLTSIPFFGDPVPDDINENNYLSVTWIEGVGSEHGIVHNNINNLPGMGTEWLLCAYRDDECRYTTDDPEYAPLGCVYNEGDVINAVEDVSVSAPSVQKIIKDGQLLIIRDGKTYNVMGVEVGK